MEAMAAMAMEATVAMDTTEESVMLTQRLMLATMDMAMAVTTVAMDMVMAMEAMGIPMAMDMAVKAQLPLFEKNETLPESLTCANNPDQIVQRILFCIYLDKS